MTPRDPERLQRLPPKQGRLYYVLQRREILGGMLYHGAQFL